ncbi:alpha/beta fold hydrolase [Streptomyces sp. NPDC047928]|uniref:alpha/beta fold hydrolase n=1 Tax=unclassified Streptomyces TaxID=2593676 RepID=UPI00371EB02A
MELLIPDMPPTPGTLRHVDLDTRIGIRGFVPRRQAETLVIGRTRDITIPLEISHALHAAIANSTCAETDAGHVAFSEEEDEFVKLVDDFTLTR